MNDYIDRSIRRQRRLNDNELKELFALRDSDKDARDLIIESNIRLVPYAIKGFRYPATDEDDIISIGMIGLINAVDSFDVKNSASFATYACTCIKNAVINNYYRKSETVQPESIDSVIYVASDGDEVTLGDTIPSDCDTFESAMTFIDSNRLQDIMKKSLTKKWYYIICSLYGLFGFEQKSESRLSKELRVSQQAISSRKATALKRLKDVMIRDGWNIP